MKIMMIALLATLLLMAGFNAAFANDPQPGEAKAEMNKDAVDGNTWTANDGQTYFTCPVCHMMHTMEEEDGHATIDGKTYYLCYSGERETLTNEPEKYLGQSFWVPANLVTYGSNGATYRDPVNGDVGTLDNKTQSVKIGHKRYFFVSEESRDQFKANPDKYIVSLDEE